MAAGGQTAALLGALLGVGIGELVPEDNMRRGRGAAGVKGGYPNASLTQDTLAQVDQLLAPRDTAPVPRRLPPVDEGGAPLDNMPETTNSGDVSYQALPSLGGEMANHADQNPDKFDTATGDAMQVQRKARVYRAISDAARINEILGQRSISRQQASALIRDYHQKYPDVNLPIQPYTSSQAAELRNRVVLEQKRDEAESQGFGRDIYTNDPTTGKPVINPLSLQKRQEQQQQFAISKADAEAKRRDLLEFHRIEREHEIEQQKNAAIERANTLKTHDIMARSLGKEPDVTTNPKENAEWHKKHGEIDAATLKALHGGGEASVMDVLAPKKSMGQRIGESFDAPVTRQHAIEKGAKLNIPVIENDSEYAALKNQPGARFVWAGDGQVYEVEQPLIDAAAQIATRPSTVK